MSLDATRWAWMLDIKPASHKLVLLSMADRADEQATCYPSIERLTSDTGLDRKTIFKAMTSLAENGIIEDTGERKGVTKSVKVYRLIGVPTREEAVPKTEQVQKRNSSVFPEEAVPKTVRVSSTKNGTQNLPEATYQKEEPKALKERGKKPEKTELPEWLDPNVWREWLDHRKQIKHPVTDLAARKAIAELSRLRDQGHDPAKVIEHSILNGWRGLFPPKASPDRRPRTEFDVDLTRMTPPPGWGD